MLKYPGPPSAALFPVSNEIQIRNATAADVEAVRAIAHETWRDTYRDLLDADWINEHLAAWYEPGLVASQIEAAEASGLGQFLLAEAGRQIVGYLHFELMDDRGPYLRRLYLLPAHQRSGAGRKLVGALHQRLDDGFTYELDVHPENSNAIAFYKGFGAEFTGGRIEPCWDLMRVTVQPAAG
jgi:ribosomal protein S18 acetylase RimI-like enzyme